MKKFFKILFWTVFVLALLIICFIEYLTLCWNHTQYLSDLPDSVWYSKDTNMKATVYNSYDEGAYMLVIDLTTVRNIKWICSVMIT